MQSLPYISLKKCPHCILIILKFEYVRNSHLKIDVCSRVLLSGCKVSEGGMNSWLVHFRREPLSLAKKGTLQPEKTEPWSARNN
jgi:hypothetical protein